MKTKIFYILSTGFLGLILAGCAEDDEKYRSEPPMIADMVITSLKDGSNEVHVGDRFIVTLQQKKKGLRLNATQYTWNASPSDDISHRYNRSVIYDQERQDPVDTLIATQSGNYRISFIGKYNASGNTNVWSHKHGATFTESFGDGNGQVTYTTGGILYFTVQAYKNVRVLP